MKRRALVSQLVSILALTACSSNQGSGFGDGGAVGPTTTPTEDGSTPVVIGGGDIDSGTLVGTGTGTGTGPSTVDGGSCASTSTNDFDGDGWTVAEGDCNDCNKYINPGAYDIAGNGIDEDCDGKADDEPTGCDSTLTSVATTAGSDGAKALDLCRTTTDAAPLPMKTWGVVSADYVMPDGSPTPTEASGGYRFEYGCSYNAANAGLGYGILSKFGSSNVVQEGTHMLGLSSGTARQPTDPGYQSVSGYDKCYTTGAPSGFPGQTPACGSVQFGAPHDGAALRVVLRVPTNALTMSFDSNFFSYEFPEWVCSAYNDTYVVIMTPTPAGEPSTANDNIAFDSKGNVVSINAGFLTVCDPTTTAGANGTGSNAGAYSYTCSEGPTKLLGTGFGSDTPAPSKAKTDHASTDWLTTTVSVAALAGKDVTLLFAVWDSSDGELDTTVLVDNVHWTFATAPNTPPPVVTAPVTQPK